MVIYVFLRLLIQLRRKIADWETNGKQVTWNARGFISVGDDFRMGMFNGAPIIGYHANGPNAIWPSTWVTTVPPMRTVRKNTPERVADAMEESVYEYVKVPKGRTIQGQGGKATKQLMANPREIIEYKNPIEPYYARSYTDANPPPLYSLMKVADIVPGKPVVKPTSSTTKLRIQEAYLDFWILDEGTDTTLLNVVVSNRSLTMCQVVKHYVDQYEITLVPYIGPDYVAIEWQCGLDQGLRGTGLVRKRYVPFMKHVEGDDYIHTDKAYISMDEADEAILRSMFTGFRQWVAQIWDPNWQDPLLVVDPERELFMARMKLHNVNINSDHVTTEQLRAVHEREFPEARDDPNKHIRVELVENHFRVIQGQATERKQIEPHEREAFGNLQREPPTTMNIRRAIIVAYGKMEEGDLNARMALNDIKTQVDTVNIHYDVTQSGPSHTPTFSCKCSFMVNNPVYDKKSGEAFDAMSKKACEEQAARILLKILFQLKVADEPSEADFMKVLMESDFRKFANVAMDTNSLLFTYLKKKQLEFVVVASFNEFNKSLARIKVGLKRVDTNQHWKASLYFLSNNGEDDQRAFTYAARNVLLQYAISEGIYDVEWKHETMVNSSAPFKAAVLGVLAQPE